MLILPSEIVDHSFALRLGRLGTPSVSFADGSLMTPPLLAVGVQPKNVHRDLLHVLSRPEPVTLHSATRAPGERTLGAHLTASLQPPK